MQSSHFGSIDNKMNFFEPESNDSLSFLESIETDEKFNSEKIKLPLQIQEYNQLHLLQEAY